MLFANWAPPARVLIDNVSEWYSLVFVIYRCFVGFAVLNVAARTNHIRHCFSVCTKHTSPHWLLRAGSAWSWIWERIAASRLPECSSFSKANFVELWKVFRWLPDRGPARIFLCGNLVKFSHRLALCCNPCPHARESFWVLSESKVNAVFVQSTMKAMVTCFFVSVHFFTG